MENYQELYNKILDELSKLQEKNSVLKKDLDDARDAYNGIKQKVEDISERYKSLIQERDSLVKTRKENTHFILLFLLSIVFILSFVFNLAILTPIIVWINKLITMTDFGLAVLSIGIYLVSIVLSTLLNVIIFKRANNFFVDRTYNKTVNSEEYKELEKQINEIMKMRQSLFLEELKRKNYFDEIDMKVSILDEKINERESFLDYIKYELNDRSNDNKAKISNDVKVKRREQQ